MRRFIQTASVLSALTMSSCTSLYQRVMDYGAVYEGVEVRDIETCYHYQGRRYLKGHKAYYRRSGTKPLITLFGGDYYESFSLIEGSEGEAVYHIADKWMEPVEGYDWISLPEAEIVAKRSGTRYVNLSGDSAPFNRADITGERELTPHALYTYPLGMVAGICVDVPITIISSCVWGGVRLILLPYQILQ